MTTTDGGTNAAYGFNFQFVTTAEFFLRHLRENFDKVGTLALHIESVSLAESAEHDDIVDFAIEEDGAIDTKVQVKASRTGRALGAPEAERVFAKLSDSETPNIRLMTNRPLSQPLQDSCLVANASEKVIEYALNNSEGRVADEVVALDSRTIGELTDSLENLGC